MAKAILSIDCPTKTIELMHRAWSLAVSGRPGPVVIELPEDVLGEIIDSQGADLAVNQKVETPPVGAFTSASVVRLVSMLNQAERPVAIIGDIGEFGDIDTGQAPIIASMLDDLGMPLIASFRRQGHAGPWLQNYAGDLGLGANPKLIERVQQADFVLLLNAPISEIPSQGFTWVPGENGQNVVQVLPSGDELGRWFAPTIGLVGHVYELLNALKQHEFFPNTTWRAGTDQARQDFEDWSAPVTQNAGAVQMTSIIKVLHHHVPEAIMCNGAGNYASWLHRFWRYQPGCQLAPTSGSMGYGLPAAIAAKLERPERNVVCWAGDGCLQMTIQELATAAERCLPICVLVIDNGMYGTIRMHQEKHFPGRVSATSIDNPDFAKVAQAYGWHVAQVCATEAFEPALLASLAHDGPSLIHVILDPEAITPSSTLAGIRAGF